MILAHAGAALFLLAAPIPAETAEQLYAHGVKLFEAGRPAEAIIALEQSIAEQPKYAASWKVIGVIQASKGDYSSAETNFRQACALDPRLPDACFYHGRALYLVNRFMEALSVLHGQPADRRRHRIQALCLDALGRWSEAEAEYRKAIEVDPGGEDPRVDYGIALSRQGRAEEAIPLLKLAIKMGRQPLRAELELGRALLQVNRLAEAREHLEKAVALDAQSAPAHLLLGRVYQRLGLEALAAKHLRFGSTGAK